jgi:predicted DNA-binding transcriptional regulator YafY
MGLLESRGELNVAAVARTLGYTPRTVYRDLAVLERIGVPIYQERSGRRSRWRVVEGYRRRFALTLSWSEMVALAVGQRFVAGLRGSVLDQAGRTGIEKIRAALPKELVARAESVGRKVTASAGATHEHAERVNVLDRVLDALDRQESVRISHRKPGEPRGRERVLDPYHLHVQGGAAYLMGWDHRRRELRTFLVDRIRSVEPTGERFEPRADFAPDAFLQGGFGPWAGRPVGIELRFDRRAAPFVAERRVHPSQANQWRNDGRLDVTMRSPIGPALVAWLLGWGARVEVVSPRRLAELVQGEHAKAAGPVPETRLRKRDRT